MSVKEMDKKSVPRGTLDYCSTNGILAASCMDNKVVTLLSSDAGIEPKSSVQRYDRKNKDKKEVTCPDVIKKYNRRIGGIDKSDMLTHLYNTPMKARRWYIKLFGYAIDLCVCNAWVLCKRDCESLGNRSMPLKQFRLDISHFMRCTKDLGSRATRKSRSLSLQVDLPKRGQRTCVPSASERQDTTVHHMPHFVTMRQTCKFCSKKGDIHRSR
ncbi:hypothetical protein Pmani_008208 [Petrolisthes manimaculis]|uniref:PiggyBac transposable element-derived protein domain-containing protein n=1 Tax=Petrolisthes manimaculis TaxID=1843537 RepID=A0AAE1Q7E1_9EUCA|nr:hypothetical protein Pmani_008208 [Petrolisthes manimaculis]